MNWISDSAASLRECERAQGWQQLQLEDQASHNWLEVVLQQPREGPGKPWLHTQVAL